MERGGEAVVTFVPSVCGMVAMKSLPYESDLSVEVLLCTLVELLRWQQLGTEMCIVELVLDSRVGKAMMGVGAHGIYVFLDMEAAWSRVWADA